MLLELKANLGSVPCMLGGGAHEYIGILLSPRTYVILAPLEPFADPIHPGMLHVVH